MAGPTQILLFGDMILDVERPDHWLSGIAPVAQAADIAVAHLEVPHTRRGIEMSGDVPAPGADPSHLAALRHAGFDAVTLAGNHIADCGAIGIADTIAELDRLGIASCGADASLASASRPAILRHNEREVAMLSYNCVGPQSAWAAADSAGCAYVRIDPRDGTAISPQSELIDIDATSLADMQANIAAACAPSRLTIVALHKGITHRPATLAPYECSIAHAAIDAGADIVIGHHGHIPQGIEMYRGRPVYHGLGNGCVVTRALSPTQDHPARAEWARRREELFGFKPDPAYPLAPFHPEAVNGLAARLLWHGDGSLQAGFVPLWFEPPGRPIIPNGNLERSVSDHVKAIGPRSGLAPLTYIAHSHWHEIMLPPDPGQLRGGQ